MRAKVTMILAGTLTVALGASAVTYALFSASAVQEQIFSAGTVALYSYRDAGDTIEGPMFYTTPDEGESDQGLDGRKPTGFWAPGDSHRRVLIVTNTGDLDVWLTGVGAELAAGSSRHMADKLTYKITLDPAGSQVLAQGNLGELIDHPINFAQKVPMNVRPVRVPRQLNFFLTLPLDADNSYQTETLRVDFKVFAEQKRNNP